MRGFFRSAFVIGRRDFIATVYSRTFLFFLAGPLIIIGISVIFGNVAERSAIQDLRPAMAVVADEAGFAPIAAARERLIPAFDAERTLPELVRADPDYDPELQVSTLLASRDKKIMAVLTGGLARPTLTGALGEGGLLVRQMNLILEEARRHEALARAGVRLPPLDVKLVKVDQSAGSVAALRTITARAMQLLIFTLTMLLAGMLLSNLIEEKSNKVIEVLAAAVPVDAIFVGKLFSMLAVSLVGVCVWAGGAVVATAILSPDGGLGLPTPAVGWPIFALLALIYYSANYLLLGAVFIGIGSQAASIREVQTLSMPISVAQLLLLMLAMLAVGPFNSPVGIGAAIFPFSSPLVMVSRAAQTPELWPHLLAFAWQAFWVWLTLSLAAALFRRNVMKSGGGSRSRARRRRAGT